MTPNWPSTAFFCISTQLGGAERSLLDFLEDLKIQKIGHFGVILPKSSGPLIDRLTQLEIPYYVLPMPSLLLSLSRKKPWRTIAILPIGFVAVVIYMARIHRFISQNNIKTIHSTGIKFHFLLSALARFQRIKIVVHWRDILKKGSLQKVTSKLLNHPNIALVANSKITQESLTPLTSEIIYNGFKRENWSIEKSDYLKLQLKTPEDSFLIGTIGVIAHWKGQRNFIKMANSILKKFPNVHFVIVGSEIYDTSGEDGELHDLKQLTTQLGIVQQIHFVPFQSNIRPIYQSLDLLVHCSTEPEPFGRVVVEGMLSGLPVVAANNSGPDEIIQHGKNGWLYQRGSLTDMTQTIESLLNSPEDSRRIAAEAPNIIEKFSMEQYSQKLQHQLCL